MRETRKELEQKIAKLHKEFDDFAISCIKKENELKKENEFMKSKLNEPPSFYDYDYRTTILITTQDKNRRLEKENKDLKSKVETLEVTKKRLLKEKNHILEETKAKLNSIYGRPNSITGEEEIQIIIQDLYAGKPIILPSTPNNFTQQRIILDQEKEIEKLKEIIKITLA